jgi:hypothetical protein
MSGEEKVIAGDPLVDIERLMNDREKLIIITK